MGHLLLEHGLYLAAFAAVDARGRPLGLPVLEEGVLLFDRLEAPALERGGLGVADGVFDAALAVGVAHARRVRHHAVVRQGRGIDRVEFGLVQVGLEHALLEVVEHDVAAAAAEVAPGLLVQPGPGLLAGAPDHASEAAPRVTQRGHEQPRLAVAIGARHARERPLAVVDLHLLGLAVAQLAHEALDRVVGPGEAVLIHQILVDGHGIATQSKLGLDEGAVGLAGRSRRRSRWPGWGNLLRRAGAHPSGVGGHPGGSCRGGGGESLLVRADRLAIDPRDPLDLSLAGAGLQ